MRRRDALRQTSGRVDDAEQHVGDRAAAGLSEQPALDDRGRAVRPSGDPHDAAVGEHDGDAGVHREHRLQQLGLGGRQFEVVAVEALRLVLARQSEEDQHVGGGLRGGDGFGDQRGCVAPCAIRPSAYPGANVTVESPASARISSSALSRRVGTICELPAPW